MITNSARLLDLVRDMFPPPEWLFAREVVIGDRRIDAIAVDVRANGTRKIYGFEAKVSRGDWLNEVKDPFKAATARAYVDHWVVVAGGPGIVQMDELQPGDGFAIPRPDGANLELVKFSSVLGAKGASLRPIDRAFLFTVLRRMDPSEPRQYWLERERRAEQKGYAKGSNAARRIETHARLQGRPREPGTKDGEPFCP